MPQPDLDRNLTPEVIAHFDSRLRRLTEAAYSWPVKVAISRALPIGTESGRGRPVRQLHLVCWEEHSEAKNGLPVHCGKTVSVLAQGRHLYQTTPEGIMAALRLHISQFHREVTDG